LRHTVLLKSQGVTIGAVEDLSLDITERDGIQRFARIIADDPADRAYRAPAEIVVDRALPSGGFGRKNPSVAGPIAGTM